MVSLLGWVTSEGGGDHEGAPGEAAIMGAGCSSRRKVTINPPFEVT